MTPAETVEQILNQIERKARHADADAPYHALIDLPELPIQALSELGLLWRLDDLVQTGAEDTLPSLIVGVGRNGQVQIELCPFGPLALIVSNGDVDTDPVALVLVDAKITPLFPGDLDQAGQWHDRPLGQWLFPRRLSDAFALFDTLR
jgi:hypothetical protein